VDFHATLVADGVLVEVGDDGEAIQTMGDVGGALDYIQWHLNQRVVHGLDNTETGLHAACASLDGRRVLLPAASGAGKSTTVAGLVRAGWGYLTDEAAVLDDATLEVAPYPKPVTLDHGVWPLFPQVQDRIRSNESCLVPAPALHRHPSTNPAIGDAGPIAAVVSPDYVAGADTQLEPLTPGQLLMLLAQSTFAFNQDGPRHLHCLARLARTAPGYRLVIGDLDAAVGAIERVVRDTS
jgi:hypothetical protein